MHIEVKGTVSGAIVDKISLQLQLFASDSLCFNAEPNTHQGHVLPSTLVLSLLLIIVVLLTIYCLR